MKVLSKGKPRSERVWKGKCSNCTSTVIALEKELKPTSDRDGEYAAAPCPECNNRMFFYPKAKR